MLLSPVLPIHRIVHRLLENQKNENLHKTENDISFREVLDAEMQKYIRTVDNNESE